MTPRDEALCRAVLEAAAQMANDLQSDDPQPGTWNDACEYIRGEIRYLDLSTIAVPPTDENAMDAARYRWLRRRLTVRNQESLAGDSRPGIWIHPGAAYFDAPVIGRDAPELDAAIDAAMKEGS